jgi:cytochrome c553
MIMGRIAATRHHPPAFIPTMLRYPILCAYIALAMGTPPSARADDAALGREKARACAACHGPSGLSIAPDAPHLAGQPSVYIVAQLRAFRSGTRKHEVMAVIAKPLSDEDIAQLAAWFSTIRIDAQLPP